MTARRVLVALLVTLICGGAIVGVVSVLDDDDGSGAGVDPSATISDTGRELLARLERGSGLTVHIRYEAGAGGGGLEMEVWRSEGRVRQDIRIDVAGLRQETSAFELADGDVRCQRSPDTDARWACERTSSAALGTEGASALVAVAAANLTGADVEVTEDTILETPVHCYAIDRDDVSSTICVTDDGVPLRIAVQMPLGPAVQTQEITATDLDREVDDTAFELPAAPVDPSSTS